MNLFECSSDDSELETLMAANKKKTKLPKNMSIDSLLEDRQKEKEFSNTSDSTEDADVNLLNQKRFNTDPFIDGTVFTEEEIHFPPSFFTKILLDEGSQSLDIDSIHSLAPWVYQAAIKFPHLIPVDSELVYTLLNGLATTGEEINGDALYNLIESESFPEHFLEFSKVYQLFKLIVRKDERLAIYPLILLRATFIQDYESNLLEFAHLLVGGIISTRISSHPLFYIVPNLLIDALSNEAVTSQDQKLLAKEIFEAMKELPLESTGAIVSFLPMDEQCVDFSLSLGIMLLSSYLDIDNKSDQLNSKISNIINHLKTIETLCQAGDPKKVQVASAAIALIERVIVLATKFKHVDKKKIDRVIRQLQMSLYGKKSTDFTIIKEQLHLTRVHLENISREAFGNIAVEENPFD